MEKERSLKTLPLDGGALPFHFINTVYAWKGKNLCEYLNNYGEFLEWCHKVNLLPKKISSTLRTHSLKNPQEAENSFTRIKEVRYLLYQLFSGIVNERPLGLILDFYNNLLLESQKRYHWTLKKKTINYIPSDTIELLLPVYMVIKQSHDLLLNEDTRRIKECPLCGWIFLDTTKNNKRKWCNPATCGSVEKTAKYYQRIKKEQTKSRQVE